MPVQPCTKDGKPGFKWGPGGACFTYDPKDGKAKLAAKKKALDQGVAISYSQKRAGKPQDIPV